MKRLNNKGFSLVEILIAIALLAILMTIASQAYNTYKKQARQQAYDTMAKSATVAATNYLMENNKAKYITFETLKDMQYVDTLQDPRYKERECTGIVINKVIPGESLKQLDELFQKVKLCCKNYKYQYDYTGDEVKVTEIDSCEYIEGDEIDGVYKLIYKPQGGTPCDPGVVIKNQREEWGPLCVTTKEGTVFKEWNTKKNGTGSTITEHTLVGSTDVNAYAIWTEIYNLTYSEEGGTACSPKTIERKEGEKWGTLCTTSKTGYVFKGWTTKKGGEGSKITNNTYAEKNLTVYAHWNPLYTLTYDSNGGSTCNPASKTVEKGESWGALCTPTRTGYTFDGWNTKKDGTGNKITSSSEVTGNITVYAKWTQNKYTLKYNSNGGTTCNPSSITRIENEAWGTLCEPTRTGYTFAGWKNGTTAVTSSSKATENITVTAQWTQNTYTLTYNSNGGTTCNPASITRVENAAWGTLCEPTRIGYRFAGWKNGTTIVTSSSTATANITVTAQWTQLHTLPIFTYTGSYQLVEDNDTIIASGTNNKVTIPSSYSTYTGNWKIRFLTDGTLTFQELRSAANGIDIWLVGGGGNGGTSYGKQAGNHGYSAGGAGGGGGEMVMKTVSVSTSSSYVLDIAASASKTKAFGYTANPGSVGGSNQGSLSQCDIGPNPGAGGTGNGGYAGGAGGRGGVNACDPYHGSNGRCEFNNCSLYSKYYGGGGGGGHGHNGALDRYGEAGNGGLGGGGTGNNQVRSSSSTSHHGQANTGGGGGGASFQLRSLTASSGCWTSDGCYEISSTQYIKPAGNGGTGIVIIRNKR